MLRRTIHTLFAIWIGFTPVVSAEQRTAAAETAATEVSSEELAGASSLERFIEFQQFIESAQDPDWLLTIAGIAMIFWGAQNLARTLMEIPSSAIPSGIKFWRVKKAQKQGRTTLEVLESVPPVLQSLGTKAKAATENLTDHLARIPDRRLKKKIRAGNSAEVIKLLENTGVRTQVESSRKGKIWLGQYDEKKVHYDSAMDSLITEFNKASDQLLSFSELNNKLAEGLLFMEGLRHKPINFRAERSHIGEPGGITIYKDSGFNQHMEDPRFVKNESHAMVTACQRMMAQLTNEGVKASVAMKMSSVLKPLSNGAIVAGGYGLYRLGAMGIRRSHQVEPEELVEQAKQRKQVEAIQSANRSQQLTSLYEKLRNDRKLPEKETLREAYGILREGMRKHMSKLAEDVRYRTSYETRLAADFNENMKRFEQDDEFANNIIDSALAEAGLSELRVSETQGISEVLISVEAENEAMLSRLLMKQFAFSAKYLWPKLTIEGSAHPVEASTVAEIVSDVVPQLKQVGEKAKASKTPVPPADKKGASTGSNLPTGTTSSLDREPSPVASLKNVPGNSVALSP